MSTSVLAFASRYSITRVVYVLFMDVGSGRDWHSLLRMHLNHLLVQTIQVGLFVFYQSFWLVKIVLSAHAALGLRTCLSMQSVTATFVGRTSCCRTSTIRSLPCLVVLAEIVEIVEH